MGGSGRCNFSSADMALSLALAFSAFLASRILSSLVSHCLNSTGTTVKRQRLAPGNRQRTDDKFFGDTTILGATRAKRALKGIRATRRCEQPIKPEDPFLLRDVTALLIDCGLRPDECFRLRWEHVRDGAAHVPFGKTENARRTIPLTPRTAAFLAMRRSVAATEWVFSAPTKSGHVEKSSLKKQHAKACKLAKVGDFVLYTFRHTCLTRWAAYMDPYTLAYLAGHRDFSTTRRYVHPQADTIRAAMERARKAQAGHNSGHSDEKLEKATGGTVGLTQ